MKPCEHEKEHELAKELAVKNMPNEGALSKLSELFKAISEPSRLKILFALRQGEMCVQHIVESVGGKQSAVSHQLRILKDSHVIKSRRDGQNIVYSLADEHVIAVLELANIHLNCEVEV